MSLVRHHHAQVLAPLAVLIALSAPVSAAPVDELLDMTSLPSSVAGWSYSISAHLGNEATAYSVSSGVLHQNTMGLYAGGAGSNCYIKSVTPDLTLDWVLEARVRVLDWEVTDGAGGNERFAAGFYATPVGQMGVFPNYIDPISGLAQAEGVIDHADNGFFGAAVVSQWHTYSVHDRASDALG